MWRRLVVACILASISASALAAQANWESELREMGYLFLHISNINVVNGLNLTRDQAVRLRRLARQVESVAQRPPSFRAPMSPELAAVRKTWLELRGLLLRGKPVPEDLQRRVNKGRATESRVVRSTLRSRPTSLSTSCISCHRAPRSGASPSDAEPMAVTPLNKRLVSLAHIDAVYGKRGLVKLVSVSPQVEAILTDGQKSILSGFSCCLVPPQDLSDPMRAGQAESSEKALDLLRRVRKCPEKLWPILRAGILGRVDQVTDAVSPGATAARRAAARRSVAQALDRARRLSDVEFEMEKAKLSKALRAAIIPPAGDAPHKAAYFLLIPGASRVYDRYLKRLARRDRVGARE